MRRPVPGRFFGAHTEAATSPHKTALRDEAEDVVAIILLREHHRGHQARPTQGDGGIDVPILSASPGALPMVQQVKKIRDEPGGHEKRQIEKSVRRLEAWPIETVQ